MNATEVLLDLFDLALTGVAGVTRRIAFMEKPSPEPPPSAGITERMWARVEAGQVYIKGLARLVISCVIIPIPILFFGIFANLGWLVATIGIFWTLWTLLILVLTAPIGMLLEFILGGIKGIAERYVKFSLGVFLVELLFTLFVSVVPIQNNLSAIPIVIIASAILGVIATQGAQTPITKKFISILVTIVLIIFTLSFFFPRTFESFKKWGQSLDLKMSGSTNSGVSKIGNALLPPGGLMETAHDSLEYYKSLAESRGIPSQTLEKKISKVKNMLPEFLPSSKTNFYFDDKVITIKVGEHKKILLKPGVTSPIIKFPICSRWGLIMEDSVEVWPEPGYGKKYISTPNDEHTIRWSECRLTGRGTVTAFAKN
jgi:hypothetical protein